jgi:Alpha-glutamyl/putrescinyl thymine pyrophosphorylase clade 3
MRPTDRAEADRLRAMLARFEDEASPLPGLGSADRRDTFIGQLVESDRRKRYIRGLSGAELSAARCDPTSTLFDPLKAAVIHHRSGNSEEAFWMVFLFVHFGRSRRGGWGFARTVYGSLGAGTSWGWDRVSTDPVAFQGWLAANLAEIESGGPGGFGNHRKYESLAGTGRTVVTYVAWVGGARSHGDRFNAALSAASGDRRLAFAQLFRSMEIIHRFGRTARFDYLSTVSKLDFAAIEPDRAYLGNATGPLTGARQLFGGGVRRPAELDRQLVDLETYLGVGLDTLEDAVCNWQKSPSVFRPFRA